MQQIDPQRTFETAIRHHEAGRLPEAEALYRQILAVAPNHIDSLHLLGMIAAQCGQNKAAVDLITRAIALNKTKPMPEFHNNLGLAYRGLGQWDSAEVQFRRALALRPNFAEPHNNLGLVSYQQGKFEEAAACYRRALAANPQYLEAINNLGNVLPALGRLDEAADMYRRAIGLAPNLAELHNNLGIVLRMKGALDDAEESCRRALALNPGFAEAYNNLGAIAMARRDWPGAEAHLERALNITPQSPEIHHNFGVVRREQGRWDDAEVHYYQALKLNPNFAEAHNSLGVLRKDQRLWAKAETCCRRAVALKPNYADGYNNLGAALMEQDKLEEAEACFDRALALQPKSAQTYNNLGAVRALQRRYGETMECYRRSLEIEPDNAEVHCNAASTLLVSGDFEKGWREYEWRWRSKRLPPRGFPQPEWDGHDLTGQRILLHAEQGVGDTFQFIRYAQLVKENARAAEIIVECPPKLVRLLQDVPGIDRLVPLGDALPSFDCHAALMSLPRMVGTTLQTVPTNVPYIHPPADVVERWWGLNASRPGLNVGLVWRGNPIHPNDHRRTIGADAIARICATPGTNWTVLHTDATQEEIATLSKRSEVRSFGAALEDWTDTAALMSFLDLVVTVDTGCAHLAGAMGKPVWVLLPFIPDWRWLLDREDSPWYPTATLFRQPAPGDWSSVLDNVAAALAKLA